MRPFKSEKKLKDQHKLGHLRESRTMVIIFNKLAYTGAFFQHSNAKETSVNKGLPSDRLVAVRIIYILALSQNDKVICQHWLLSFYFVIEKEEN